MNHDSDLGRLYARQPDLDAMRARLPDLGESLNTAAHELARDISLDKIDAFLERLKGAESTVRYLRQAVVQEVNTPN